MHNTYSIALLILRKPLRVLNEKKKELHEKHINLHEKQAWISRGLAKACESSEISISRFQSSDPLINQTEFKRALKDSVKQEKIKMIV